MSPEPRAVNCEPGEEVPGVYVLTWLWHGRLCLFDAEDPALLASCAIRLAEAGREEVKVLGPVAAEVTAEEMAAVKERVRAAIVGRLCEEKTRLRVALSECQRDRTRLMEDVYTVREASGT